MSLTRFVPVKNKLAIISANLSEKIKLPEKLKGTVIERWSIYWKSLVNDYAEVGIGAFKTAKEKPVRSSIMAAVGLSLLLAAKNNPDEESFMEAVRKRHNEMLLVHESCQRAESAHYLKSIERAINHETLRTFNLGICTIVWQHDYGKNLCTYIAICKHTQPEYSTFHTRIIDVGFWNKWWNLDRKMVDYDIGEDVS